MHVLTKLAGKRLSALLVSILLPLSSTANDNNIQQILMICDNWEGTCNKNGTGVYFDIIRAVYEPLGIKINYQIAPFKRGLKMIENNEADTLASAFKTPEREALYTYPKIRFMNEYTVLLKLKNMSPEDTNSPYSKLCMLRGFDYKSLIQPNTTIIEVDKTVQGIKMVLAKRCDAFMNAFYNSYMAIYQLKLEDYKVDLTQFEMQHLTTEPIYLIFPKTAKGKQLAALYDDRLPVIYKQGTISRIANQQPIGKYYDYFPEVTGEKSPPISDIQFQALVKIIYGEWADKYLRLIFLQQH